MPQQWVNKAASAVLSAGTAAQKEFPPEGWIVAPLFLEMERRVLFVDAGTEGDLIQSWLCCFSKMAQKDSGLKSLFWTLFIYLEEVVINLSCQGFVYFMFVLSISWNNSTLENTNWQNRFDCHLQKTEMRKWLHSHSSHSVSKVACRAVSG